jgi:hypothetical protein
MSKTELGVPNNGFQFMADIHDAAGKNDLAFIQASAPLVDALGFRSGGGSHGTPPRVLLRHVAAIPQGRRRHQRTKFVRHSTTRPFPF